MTIEYIIWPKISIPSSYFTILMLNCFRKYVQTPVWQLCDSCQIIDLINFQNNLTRPNSNTAGISLDSRLKYRYAKKPLHSLSSCTVNFPLIQIPSILSVNFYSPVALMPESVFMGQLHLSKGMVGTLIVWWPASFWSQWTMADGTVHGCCAAKFPTKPSEA